MKLLDLLKDIDPLQIVGNKEVEVTGIQSDSRRVERGNIFVAQKGTTVDGHMYIGQCLAKGAQVVVIEDAAYMPEKQEEDICYVLVKNSDEALGKMAHTWYGRPSQQLKLIGVTGTNGKTTTATLLYRLFKALGHKVGLLSTVVNYVDGVAIEATHTTPDALSLNALLAQMVAAGCS